MHCLEQRTFIHLFFFVFLFLFFCLFVWDLVLIEFEFRFFQFGTGKLVKPFGLEADRHLLRCLFSSIDFNDANQTARHSLQAKLLNQELNAVLNKSSLITNICFAVDNCFPQQKVSCLYALHFLFIVFETM